jgi:hypothetical protein
MHRNTVHESQTRVSQAKFLLVLLVLKFEKSSELQGFQAISSTPHKSGESESANIVGAHV